MCRVAHANFLTMGKSKQCPHARPEFAKWTHEHCRTKAGFYGIGLKVGIRLCTEHALPPDWTPAGYAKVKYQCKWHAAA